MTRLLFADQYGGMGGGQRVLMSLLKTALQTGADVSVLAPGGGALETAIANAFGGRVNFVACEEPRMTHGRKGLADMLALLRHGWNFRCYLPLLAEQDVIYVNGLRHLPYMLLLTRGLKARLIYHVHIGHSRAEKWLLKQAARARSTWRLIINSRFVQDGLDIPADKICLIENALDASFASRAFIDRFTGDAPRVAAVMGTVRPEKGQDIALAAVSRQPSITLHVIGPDGDGAAAWIEAMKRSAGPNVHFHGSVPDIAQAMDRLGVQFNLVPSRWDEPFGLVAIEGMACSCITIVSGRGGLAEIAERTGALIAPDAESLGRLVEDLCARPGAALSALARSQHEKTMAHYGPARFEAEIHTLLVQAAD
jgi:glycosyltransferase involved in cell wall biosynthesis